MFDLSRRQMLLTGGAATVAATAPSRVFAQAAGAAPTASGAAWDLRDIFPSDAAWEAERQSLLAAIARLKAEKGTLGRSPARCGNNMNSSSSPCPETSRTRPAAVAALQDGMAD